MRGIARIAPLTSLVLVSLACGLITAPISGVQDIAATAEALATSLPSDMPQIPGIPDVSAYLNPVGAPAAEWKGIPIMAQASAGEEFDEVTYSYRVPGVTGIDVEAFYDARLEGLGWKSPARTNVGSAGGYMLFTKGTAALNIMVTKSEGDIVVLLIMP